MLLMQILYYAGRLEMFLRTILGIIFISFSSTSWAETVSRSVKSGAKIAVGGFHLFNRNNCSSAPFARTKLKQPKNGKLTIVKRRLPVAKGRKCAGKMQNMVVVYYQSKRGYRGKDQGTAFFNYAAYRGEAVYRTYDVKYKITVK